MYAAGLRRRFQSGSAGGRCWGCIPTECTLLSVPRKSRAGIPRKICPMFVMSRHRRQPQRALGQSGQFTHRDLIHPQPARFQRAAQGVDRAAENGACPSTGRLEPRPYAAAVRGVHTQVDAQHPKMCRIQPERHRARSRLAPDPCSRSRGLVRRTFDAALGLCLHRALKLASTARRRLGLVFRDDWRSRRLPDESTQEVHFSIGSHAPHCRLCNFARGTQCRRADSWAIAFSARSIFRRAVRGRTDGRDAPMNHSRIASRCGRAGTA